MLRAVRIGLFGAVAAGLCGALLTAFGLAPNLGAQPGLDAFRVLLEWPGLARASVLSVQIGLGATIISLSLCFAVLAALHQSRAMRWIEAGLPPLLAAPHAAMAFGIAFVIAPSGWISRALSPWLTGWQRPPDLLIIADPQGLSMILALALKETPFLVLMSIAALNQIPGKALLRSGQSLGCAPATAWLKLVAPLVYRQIRIPVAIVLAYGMTAIEPALILGPSTPAPLSVQILRWTNDPQIQLRMVGAAAALWQFVLVLLALGIWRLCAQAAGSLHRRWSTAGRRGTLSRTANWVGRAAALIGGALALATLSTLVLWSFSGPWRFPDPVPAQWSLKAWDRQADSLAAALVDTALIAAISTLIAMLLTIAALHQARARIGAWIYLPLLMPQIVFLPGLQVLFLAVGLPHGVIPVAIAHIVFVLPYTLLALQDPWREIDNRMLHIGATLGQAPWQTLIRLRLPLLARPVLGAAALGIAVSVGLYLPTLLMGGGRLRTVTTEAVALASGGDRRVIGVWGVAQIAASLLPFVIALLLPRLLYRNRKGLV